MDDSYSKKEAIKIIKRALTAKDQDLTQDDSSDKFEFREIENMAGEFDISRADLQKAVTEITQTQEQKRDELFPEVVVTRRVNGRLTEKDIENLFSELKLEYEGAYQWNGQPTQVHKVGRTWEYHLQDTMVLLTDMEDGYELHVIKQQFYHGNNIEAALLAIPIAFILGFFPVTAAGWLHIFAAVFTAAICYMGSFWGVKKYTQKKRTDVLKKLLHITRFTEERLQELTDGK